VKPYITSPNLRTDESATVPDAASTAGMGTKLTVKSSSYGASGKSLAGSP
jgi:hypothetical protein